MPDAALSVYHVARLETDILGPGCRLAVWTAGCPFRCPGCIEEPLQKTERGKFWSVQALYQRLKPELETRGAITFSGGEPLFQRHALLELMHLIKGELKTDITLFTGMSTAIFQRDYRDFHACIDLCITEPFQQSRQGNYLWRGSANQQLISPSGKYSAEVINDWMARASSGLQLEFDPEYCYTYGIPIPGLLTALNENLEALGLLLKSL